MSEISLSFSLLQKISSKWESLRMLNCNKEVHQKVEKNTPTWRRSHLSSGIAHVRTTIVPVSSEGRNDIPSISVGSLQGKGVGQAQCGFSMHRLQWKEMSFTQSGYMDARRELSWSQIAIRMWIRNFRKDWIQLSHFTDENSKHERVGEREKERERTFILIVHWAVTSSMKAHSTPMYSHPAIGWQGKHST